MSIFEYDEERELALMRKAIASEAWKEGIAEGRNAGHKEGREDEIKASSAPSFKRESPYRRSRMSWSGMRRRLRG